MGSLHLLLFMAILLFYIPLSFRSGHEDIIYFFIVLTKFHTLKRNENIAIGEGRKYKIYK
jgi:hypothetical protein